MRDDRLMAVLHGLGIDAETAGVLLLLPLVQVAWADGAVQDKERTRIRDVARERRLLGEEGERVLATWLAWPPSERYAARGCMALVELAHRGGAFGPGALDDVIALSSEVAAAAGGLFDRIATVSAAEKAALADIAATLRADRGRNWEDLLAELAQGRSLPVAAGPTPADDEAFDITSPEGLPPPPGELWGSLDDDATVEQGAPAVRQTPAARGAVQGPRLELEGGDEGTLVFPLGRASNAVGRRPDNDVQVRWDPQVSRLHCRFLRSGPRWYVADSGTVNGTFVDGERVLERRLFGGEQVQIGQTRFRFFGD